MTTTELFHGSPENRETLRVNAGGLFGGIFAGSEERTARSHGANIYRVELDDGDICTTQHLNYHADPDAVQAVLDAEYAEWEHVIDEEQPEDDDDGSLGWEAQRVRGLVAAALGFRAVECSDEHGTSYLLLPGVELQRVD